MSFHDAMIILFIYNCCICITIYFYLLAIINKPIKTNHKKIKEMWARDARPSSEPCHTLLDLSNWSCGSNHRLVWRSLGVRTKMSVKTRLPRSRRVQFRFGRKSLITGRILNETSQFFCASLVGIYLFLKWP